MSTIDDSMQGKVCLVTGATGGIGLVTARALAQMGADVIVHGRSPEKGQRAVEEIKQETGSQQVTFLLADLAVQEQVRDLAAQVLDRFERLDVLVNNAGVMMLRRKLSPDGMEMTFAVNVLAPFLLTRLLLDRLAAFGTPGDPARIVNVASAAHRRGHIRLEDLGFEHRFGGMRAYGQSKLALILLTYEQARRLEGQPVTANALHPGFVATGLASNNGPLVRLFQPLAFAGALTPEEGAQTSIKLATDKELSTVTGKYYTPGGERQSIPESYDEKLAGELWVLCERLTGSA